MLFFGPFVILKGRLCHMKRLNALETLQAAKEGEDLEEALLSLVLITGREDGVGTLCAFTSRFLRRGKKRVFEDGAMVLDLLTLCEIEMLCRRYEQCCLTGDKHVK